jgi:two-component system, OmpR family, phosphate regulon sensor histidine kinase PhoR
MKIGLFTKLFIAFVATGILVAAAAEFLIERQLKKGLILWIEDEMTAEASLISLMPMEEIAQKAAELAQRSRSRLTLIDALGRVTADTDRRDVDRESHLNRSEIQEARLKGKGASVRYSHSLKMDMLYVAFLLGDQKQPKGYIRLSRSLREVTGSIDQLRQTILQDLFLVVFSSLLIALLFSRRLISPIRKLAAFTEKARTGTISGQIRIESRDEIGALAENINGMVAVLHEKIRNADEERRKLQSVFTGMAEGIAVLDPRHRIETINRGMEEMIGSRSGEMIGRTLLEAFRNIPLHDALSRFETTKEKIVLEITLGNEHPVVLEVTISAVQGENGGERKTMLVFHDVTRLKKLERIRTDFVANVTHEIKTPLTAIIGFVETLQQGAVDDRDKTLEFLQTIHENAERLNRLVDDLLTLSGIELGETNFHLERLNMEDAIGQALAVVAKRISEKKLNLLEEIGPDLPPIRADRDRLIQILLNILDNAVKFTPEGGTITVTVSPGAEEDLVVRIADTGIGISKGEIPRLGERFYRADKTRSRDLGGTGLGLSIVKHLMSLHQGRMVIESSLGRGTMVSLHFPIFLELT